MCSIRSSHVRASRFRGRRPGTLLALLIACPWLPGCALFRADTVKVEHAIITTASGVIVQDILAGEGPGALAGDSIAIDYTATLADGTPVDSTYDRGQPLTVVLGEAPLAGWDEGLLGLALGGRRHMTLPPEQAYGSDGVPGLVPPNATLVFEVERVE